LAGMDMHADPARLMQVLLNLLSNAIKYNKPDGWVRVEVGHGEWVRITVRDGGLGMTPEQLTELFDPFNRLGREASDVQGSGLGLVLVKQIVELMEGQLEIHSEAGVGTSASVTLPRHPASAGTKSSLPASNGQ
jgi:signal transduction histidine kinase